MGSSILVALSSAGRQRVRIVVPEQQAQGSGHYEEISGGGYGGEYGGGAVYYIVLLIKPLQNSWMFAGQEHLAVDEGKEESGAELTSLAHTSAVQAKNAVQSQHTAGSQAAFGIKSTLASAAQGVS